MLKKLVPIIFDVFVWSFLPWNKFPMALSPLFSCPCVFLILLGLQVLVPGCFPIWITSLPFWLLVPHSWPAPYLMAVFLTLPKLCYRVLGSLPGKCPSHLVSVQFKALDILSFCFHLPHLAWTLTSYTRLPSSIDALITLFISDFLILSLITILGPCHSMHSTTFPQVYVCISLLPHLMPLRLHFSVG